jgi:cell division protein FtsN
MKTGERGGFVMGLVMGLLIGLALALGVALYITKAPVPFVNKVPQRTAEQDTAEAERNRAWDPNAALGGKPAKPLAAAPAPAASADAAAALPAPAGNTGAEAPKPPQRDPAAILSGGAVPPGITPVPTTPPQVQRPATPAADPFIYFVQAGAYTRSEDAEQQRARLAMLGQTARISEREQAGRTVYRVRIGPYPTRDEADAQQGRLQEQAIEAQIVRVEKP